MFSIEFLWVSIEFLSNCGPTWIRNYSLPGFEPVSAIPSTSRRTKHPMTSVVGFVSLKYIKLKLAIFRKIRKAENRYFCSYFWPPKRAISSIFGGPKEWVTRSRASVWPPLLTYIVIEEWNESRNWWNDYQNQKR